MTKRPLEFHPPPTKTSKKDPTPPTPLSPSKVTSPEEHATISGLLTTLSPIKPSHYFDGEITDGDGLIRIVGFDRHKQLELQSFCDRKIPVTLRNCHIQRSKYKANTLEVVLKDHTKIEPSPQQFEIQDFKTAGSAIISLNELPNQPENGRVTVRITVLRVNEPQTVGTKTKQEVLVGDTTARATLVLWGENIQTLQQGKSYQLNRLEIRTYLGKRQLSFPSTMSMDEISDIEDVIEPTTSSDDEDDGSLQLVTVSGVKNLETIYACINCTRNIVQSNESIGVCPSCQMTQKLPTPKQGAKIMIQTKEKGLTLRANDKILKQITQLQNEVTAQDLLYSPQFNCTYNKFHMITSVSRK
jgi:hypothetical protein